MRFLHLAFEPWIPRFKRENSKLCKVGHYLVFRAITIPLTGKSSIGGPGYARKRRCPRKS